MWFKVILIKASELDSRDDCLALFRLMCHSVSLLINKKRVTHPHGQATHNIKTMIKNDAAAAADVEL